MPEEDKSLLEVRDLTKRFGAATALDRVSLTLLRGRLNGLAGPDGAGKTTLIRILTGLLGSDSGEIRLDGVSLAEAVARQGFIGYMPQKFGLYEDLSVLENLRLYAALNGVPKEKERGLFDEMLRFTDLARFSERLAGRLSGGMKQKLGLACALLGRPKLLLLDEPSVGVDPISRRELWSMVGELMEGGMTVLWSTAYLDEAEHCDKVILLDESKKLFEGPPGELTGRLKGRVFLLSEPSGGRRGALRRVLREPFVRDGVIQGGSVRFVTAPELPDGEPQALARKLGGTLAPAAPRFEDAFIDILGGGPGGESALAAGLSPLPDDGAVVVEADRLTKKYGSFTAADSISFRIRRGEIFGLLGPNGAGKSTTFKMMCGLARPTSGRALVAGRELGRSGGSVRRRIGYMAQKFSLYDGLSVRQNLAFFSGIYGLSGRAQKAKIEEMVEIFHFQNILDDNSGDISLGHKQRLALACATMHGPDVLFLDEPTSGVSPVTRREFWNHINGIVEKGVTVMVTTHFMDEAEYCDRIALIYRGRAIAVGTPDELRQSVADGGTPDPTMEDAFISLVRRSDRERGGGGA
ncbi:multidrug ABC transporter ATP-binding protein [Victivallales bacterium CCUG 44730]|uniref:ATP-binding cassette domain-containing protein n=1 Tax=uncultured Victivallis sp. TaxID=354118 RepID=UPI000D045FAC|nr:ATP-binding cassette domain-containing protein [uncultured Victivallis sp.]AVM45179.1 multidrug ABC transporter ATP-binding protein [Victivallales bacterium CCUG 44730]